MPGKFRGQRNLAGYNHGVAESHANENSHNNPVYTQHQGVLKGRESDPELHQNHTQGQRPSGGRREGGLWVQRVIQSNSLQLCDLDKLLAWLSLCSLTCKMRR